MLIQILEKVPDFCNCTFGKQNTIKRKNIKKRAHGVSNHRNYQRTDKQKALINQLTKVDQKLYKVAQKIFEEQLKKVQRDYEFKLC